MALAQYHDPGFAVFDWWVEAGILICYFKDMIAAAFKILFATAA